MAFGGPGSKSSSSMGGPASRADPKRESLAATAGKRQDTGRGRGAEQGRGGRGGGASRGRGGGRGRGADMGIGAARRLKEKAERDQQGGGNLRAMQDRSNKAAQMAADEVKRRHQEIKAATGHDDGKKEKKRRSAAAEEPRVPATKWDLEKFLMALPFDTPPDKLTALTLVNKGIGSLPTQLAFLAHIRRLDLSKNGISDVSPLVKLTGCVQVNLAHNNITTLAPLKDVMPHVTVLNVTANVLTSLDGVQTMAGLKALIAPDNKLTDVSQARRLPLDTLVLSRNTALGMSDSLWPVVHSVSSSLRKLSLASCGISALPGSESADAEKTTDADDGEGGAAGDALQLPLVNELRLSGNNLTEFPRGTMCRSLKILDIASNDFANLGSLRPSRLFLEQIHIHGNPVATFDAEKIAAADAAAAAAGEDRKHTIAHYTFELRNFVGAVFPKVRLLDGQAFSAPSKDERIARRKAAAGDDGATGSDDDDNIGERPSKATKLEKGKTKKSASAIGHGAAPIAPPKANQTADEIKAELDAKDVVMENPLGEGPTPQAGGKRSYVTKTVQPAAARPSGPGGAVGKKVGHSDKDKKKPQVAAQGQSAAAALLQSAASNSIGGW